VRKTILAAAVASGAALAGAGCSSITTHVDYDPGVRFDGYHTYSFKEMRDTDPFRMKRVREAVEKTLSTRGLTKTEGKPDLWVVLHARTHNEKVVTTWSNGWGWGWGWRGGYWTTARVENIPVGTLVIDLVDTKAKELVWRGMASHSIEGETPQENTAQIQEAVDKLFVDYPPKKT
jgi:hypothetical protein